MLIYIYIVALKGWNAEATESTKHGSTVQQARSKQPTGFHLRPRRLRDSHNLYMSQPGIVECDGKQNVFLSPQKLLFHDAWLVFLRLSACFSRLRTCSSSSIMKQPLWRSFRSCSWWPPANFVMLSAGLWLWGTHRGRPRQTKGFREWSLLPVHFYHRHPDSVLNSKNHTSFWHPSHKCYGDPQNSLSRVRWQLPSLMLLSTDLLSAVFDVG